MSAHDFTKDIRKVKERVGRERRALPDRRMGTPTGGSAAGRSRATILGGNPPNRRAENHCVTALEGAIGSSGEPG